jgi:hypothetical protein
MKVITFASVGCHQKFLTANFQSLDRILTFPPSTMEQDYVVRWTSWGIDCIEALRLLQVILPTTDYIRTVQVNLSTADYAVGKEFSSILASRQNGDHFVICHPVVW